MKTFKITYKPTGKETEAIYMKDAPVGAEYPAPRFIRDNHYKDNVWVNKIDSGIPSWGHAPQSYWEDLGYVFPDTVDKEEKSIQELVVQYLTQDGREHYFEHINGQFFNPNLDDQFYIDEIERLLEEADICQEGAKRFLDWLPDKWSDRISHTRFGRLVSINLELVVDEPYEGPSDDDGITYDIVDFLTNERMEISPSIKNIDLISFDVERYEIDD